MVGGAGICEMPAPFVSVGFHQPLEKHIQERSAELQIPCI